jgi:hypothetical protein
MKEIKRNNWKNKELKNLIYKILKIKVQINNIILKLAMKNTTIMKKNTNGIMSLLIGNTIC